MCGAIETCSLRLNGIIRSFRLLTGPIGAQDCETVAVYVCPGKVTVLALPESVIVLVPAASVTLTVLPGRVTVLAWPGTVTVYPGPRSVTVEPVPGRVTVLAWPGTVMVNPGPRSVTVEPGRVTVDCWVSVTVTISHVVVVPYPQGLVCAGDLVVP